MKKLIALLLALVMVFAMVACNAPATEGGESASQSPHALCSAELGTRGPNATCCAI